MALRRTTARLTISCVAVAAVSFASSPTRPEPGDVFVALGNGKIARYQPPATALKPDLDSGNSDVNAVRGMAFDPAGNLYATTYTHHRVIKFKEDTGAKQDVIDTRSKVESIVFDRRGDFLVGSSCDSCTPNHGRILKFDREGNQLDRWDGLKTDTKATDWIELAADQHTLFYTSEGRHIFRYDLQSRRQLPDFATLPGQGTAYALRLLPDGGVLVADAADIKRLNAHGEVIKTYSVPGEAGAAWFGLNLDTDGKSFWSGDKEGARVARFDLGSGGLLASFIAPARVLGIAIYHEPIVATGTATTPSSKQGLEEIMDTTKIVATYALLAFLVERLTNGLALLFSYSKAWRAKFDGAGEFDAAKREALDRNRRVLLFFLGAVISVIGALAAKLELLAALGITIGPVADRIVSGLLIASGSDPIRELLQRREVRRDETHPAPPIQVTGTLILQQPAPAARPAGKE